MTDEPRACDWCGALLSRGSRRDALTCSKVCRQARWRVRVRRAQLEATARPLRLAYADPPYIGRAWRYYRGEEVDHDALLSRLASFDGWALSCASDTVPALLALAVGRGLAVRLAIWHRRRPPHATARILSAWEGLIYSPARSVVSDRRATADVLLGVDARPRPTLPGSVVGMKPPAFSVWVFELLGARPGDELDDLYPGSGLVGRAWRDWSRGAGVDVSRATSGDVSRIAAANA
jgi:hypothetical protein